MRATYIGGPNDRRVLLEAVELGRVVRSSGGRVFRYRCGEINPRQFGFHKVPVSVAVITSLEGDGLIEGDGDTWRLTDAGRAQRERDKLAELNTITGALTTRAGELARRLDAAVREAGAR